VNEDKNITEIQQQVIEHLIRKFKGPVCTIDTGKESAWGKNRDLAKSMLIRWLDYSEALVKDKKFAENLKDLEEYSITLEPSNVMIISDSLSLTHENLISIYDSIIGDFSLTYDFYEDLTQKLWALRCFYMLNPNRAAFPIELILYMNAAFSKIALNIGWFSRKIVHYGITYKRDPVAVETKRLKKRQTVIEEFYKLPNRENLGIYAAAHEIHRRLKKPSQSTIARWLQDEKRKRASSKMIFEDQS